MRARGASAWASAAERMGWDAGALTDHSGWVFPGLSHGSPGDSGGPGTRQALVDGVSFPHSDHTTLMTPTSCLRKLGLGEGSSVSQCHTAGVYGLTKGGGLHETQELGLLIWNVLTLQIGGGGKLLAIKVHSQVSRAAEDPLACADILTKHRGD